METIIIAGSTAGVIGLVLSIILMYSSKIFHIETDPIVEKLINVLPGANCGACGYNCALLAEKLAKNEAEVDACLIGGQSVADRVAEILNKAPKKEHEKLRAFIFCQGGLGIAPESSTYQGIPTCQAAHLTGGNKDCTYGCLGFGDCVKSCKFNAMIMGNDFLPKISITNCIACGACVKACPRQLIELHSVRQAVHIYCKSHDKAVTAKKNCIRACIACGICVRNSKPDAIQLINNLAVIDYKEYRLSEESGNKCPTNAITIESINTIP